MKNSFFFQIEPQIEPNQIRQESLDWVPAQAYFPVTNNLTQWMTLDQHTLSHQKISTFPIEIREQDNLSIHSNELLPEFETPKVKKPRMTQSLLTEEQKQMVTEEMADANLGLLCNVCGKIFKSKDALDFHIMYTKLPGHDILQQQKLKNNYAAEAMRISAKLSDESHLPSDYGPPTPIVTYEQPSTPAEQVFDSKIGVFVKNETMPPPADPPKVTFVSISNYGQLLKIYSEFTQNLPRIYSEFIRNLPKIYPEFIQNLLRI